MTTPETTQPDDRTIVESLLALHGMTPAPDEVDQLVTGYPASRAMADALYAVPGVRYEEPAVTFDPRV